MGAGGSAQVRPLPPVDGVTSTPMTEVKWAASGPVGVSMMAHHRGQNTIFLVIVKHTLQGVVMSVTEKTPLVEVRDAVYNQGVVPSILGQVPFCFALPNGARITSEQEKSLTLSFILPKMGESALAYAGRPDSVFDDNTSHALPPAPRKAGSKLLRRQNTIPGRAVPAVLELSESDSEDEEGGQVEIEEDLIVISYSSEQDAFREEVTQLLRQRDYNVWHGGMVGGGSDWRQEWTAKAERAKTFIFIVSESFMKSKACNVEIAFVSDVLKRDFIPICFDSPKLTNTFKMLLATNNWIDNTRTSWRNDLLSAVKKAMKVTSGSEEEEEKHKHEGEEEKAMAKLRRETDSAVQRLAGNARLVFVGGSVKFYSDKTEPALKRIAQLLAECSPPIAMVTGGMAGVGEAASRAYFDAKGHKVIHILPAFDPSDHSSRAPQNKDTGRFSPVGYGETVFAGQSVAEREQVTAGIAAAHILAEGGPGARREAELSAAKGTKLVPLGMTGGAASDLKAKKPESVSEEDWKMLKNAEADVETYAAAAVRCIVAAVEDWEKEAIERSIDDQKKVRIEPSFGSFYSRLKSFNAVYIFEGHGAVQGYADSEEDMQKVVRSVVVDLDARHGKGKWCIMYGGDPYRPDKRDIGVLVRQFKVEAGCFVAAVSNDCVEKYWKDAQNASMFEHVDVVYFIRTETYMSPTGVQTYWGGYNRDVKGLLVGPSSVMFHPILTQGAGQGPKKKSNTAGGFRPESRDSNYRGGGGSLVDEMVVDAFTGLRTRDLRSYPSCLVKGVMAFGGGMISIDDCEYAASIGLPVYYKAMKARNTVRGENGAIDTWAKMRLIKEEEWSLKRHFIPCIR